MKKTFIIFALSSALSSASYAQTCPDAVTVAGKLATLGSAFAKLVAQKSLVKNKNGEYPEIKSTTIFAADLVKSEDRNNANYITCNYRQLGSETYDILYSITLAKTSAE